MTELEHALSRRFATSSTSVTHLADSAGRLTIQVSWVVSVVLAPRVLGRYAAMSTASCVRARDRPCGMARDVARNVQRAGHAAGCSATLDVSEPMLEEAARAG